MTRHEPLMAALTIVLLTVSAGPDRTHAAPTAAEQYILAQTAAGEVADLSERFPKPEERKLRAKFLEDLLTGETKGVVIARKGVRILGARLEDPLDLSQAEVKYPVWLMESSFGSEVNFSGARFERDLVLDWSTFAAPASFKKMTVKDTLSLYGCLFEQMVSFQHSVVTRNFVAGLAHFKSQNQEASFNTLDVGKLASFEAAGFYGTTDFTAAHVGGNFQADGSYFHNPDVRIHFNSMKVDQHFMLSRAFSESAVSFRVIRIGGNMYLTKTQFRNSTPPGQIKHDDDTAKILYNADFRHGFVENVVRMDDMRIAGKYTFSGMKYQALFAGDGSVPDTWDQFKPILAGADFSADAYAALESSFKAQGYPNEADDVFIEQKKREQANLQGTSWAWSVITQWVVGFGRQPQWALAWSFGFVIIGYAVFRERFMVPMSSKEQPHGQYNAFWYSLDLFLPLTQLYAGKVWIPADHMPSFFWGYMRIHHLAGWILVPLGLAAITGVLK